VTVFCPNCGSPNTDEATACAKCGTALKAAGPKVAPSKFKGTMMMSGVTPPRPQAPGAGLPPPAAPAAAPPAAAPESKQNLAFQATMLGPMTPPPGMPPLGAPPAAPSAFGATTPAAGGAFGAPPPASDGGFGAPPPAASTGFGAPAASDAGFGAPPAGGGFGAPPAGGGFGAPPAGGGGFGEPPAGGGFGAPPAGGFGAPPAGGGFGAPPAGGGFGAPPAGGGFGAPPAGDGGAPAPKPNNTLKYVGIGCAALLFLSCVCGGGLYWYAQKKAEEALEVLQNYQPPAGGDPAAAAPLGAEGAGAAGDGACARVERCCPAFYTSRGLGSEQAAATCSQMAAARAQAPAAMLEAICNGQLQGFAASGGGNPLPPECK
jgi:hypothetical protein